jgi:hypothetical protein
MRGGGADSSPTSPPRGLMWARAHPASLETPHLDEAALVGVVDLERRVLDAELAA